MQKKNLSWEAALGEVCKWVPSEREADQLLIEAESFPGRETGDKVKVTYDKDRGKYTVRTT